MTLTFPAPETPTPTVEDLELDQYTISGIPFQTLLADRQKLKQMIEDAEIVIQDIDQEVAAALDLKGVKSVIWTSNEDKKYLVIRREASKPRPLLDRTLLLSAGVTPLQLQAGTKFGKPGKGGITVKGISKNGPGSETEFDGIGETGPETV